MRDRLRNRFAGSDYSHLFVQPDGPIAKLQDENQRLKQEIRILKKCAAQMLETADRVRSVMGGTEGADSMPSGLPQEMESLADPSVT